MANYIVDTPSWFDTPRLKEYVLEQMRGEHWGRALKALRVLQQRGEHEFVDKRFDFVIHYAAVSDDLLDGYTTPRPEETNEFVFGPPAGLGGIGDNIIFSLVPRAARIAGYKTVLIHRDHGLSEEAYGLIWGNRTGLDKVDGVTDQERTNASCWMWDIIQSVYSPKRNLSMLQRICMAYGLDPFLVPSFPIVSNFERDSHSDVRSLCENRVVVDVGSNSSDGRLSEIDPNRVTKSLQEIGINEFIVVCPKNPSTTWQRIGVPGEVLECKDLHSYFNVVESAETFVTVSNGGYWIAAALRKNKKRTVHVQINGSEHGYPSWMTMPFESVLC